MLCAVLRRWGGLRGSVGLALALAIGHTTYSHSVWGGDEIENEDRELPRMRDDDQLMSDGEW